LKLIMSKLSINLITWNGEKYISYLFESLRNQTYKDWELFVLDNGSGDGTVAAIERELKDFSALARLIKNEINVGFAVGHNRALAMAESEYVLLLNQDIILAPDYLEKAVAFLEAHPEAAALQGKLFRWNFPSGRTETIDSLGLAVFKNRRVIDIVLDENADEVFGLSGAVPMFRRSALAAIKINGEIFDEDFFSYKEDIDLAYRLRIAGLRSFIIRDARAWHDRAAAAERVRNSVFVNYHSYKNHLFVLVKNEYCKNLLIDFLPILWYEIKKFVYLLFCERNTLAALKDVFRLSLKMLGKRKIIKARRKLSAKQIREWFI